MDNKKAAREGRFFLYFNPNLKLFNMKKVFLVAGLLFGITSMNAQSYEVSLGLGALTSAQLKLEGMYHLDDHQSFNLELRAINQSLESEDEIILASAGGFAISPEYMTYFNSSNDANEGMYLGTYLRFKTMSTQGWEELDMNGMFVPANFSQTAFGAGLNLGWHGALDNGLSYRVYAGAGYNFVNAISHTDTYESALSVLYGVPFHIRSGINIGYRF
jgi:hypothetical protein